MSSAWRRVAIVAVGLGACGGDAVVGDPGTTGTTGTTGTGDGPPSTPTTSVSASATEPATSGVTDGGMGSTGSTGSGDTTLEVSTLGSSSSGDGSSSSTGVEVSSSTTTTGETTTGETTTGWAEACMSDTSADPSPWSVNHGVADAYFGVGWTGAAPGAVVYMTEFDGVLDLGGGPMDPDGASHVFLASHASSGGFAWAEHIGGPALSVNFSEHYAAMDCAGNLVVAGSFRGEIGVQGAQLVAVPGMEFDDGMSFATVDWFVMKFGPDGKLLWTRRFGDMRSQRLHQLGIQSDGTIVVSGAVLGTLELGGPPIVVDGVIDHAVLAAFDPDGGFLWQREFAGSEGVGFWRLAVGAGDQISVLASATGSTDLGGGVLPKVEQSRILAQFAADGSHRWSQRWQHASHLPWRVGVDAAGGTVLSGYSFPGDGTFPGFVLRHDPDGAFHWTRAFVVEANSPELVDVAAMVVADEVVVSGTFIGSVDFGGGDLNGEAPTRAMFVARYDLAGEHLASDAYTATLGAYPNAVAIGGDGEVVVGGVFKGSFDLGGGPMVSVGEYDLFLHRFGP